MTPKYQQYRLDLAAEIRQFLSQYATRSANDPEMYSSPDAHQLEAFANLLESDHEIDLNKHYPFASWGSGGFKPYTSREGRRWLDEILDKISALRSDSASTHGK